MYIFNIIMLYILYLYFSAYFIKFLLNIHLKILFTHPYLGDGAPVEAYSPPRYGGRGDERVDVLFGRKFSALKICGSRVNVPRSLQYENITKILLFFISLYFPK